MLLSKAPPIGFTASILRNSEESLVLYIVSPKDRGVGISGGGGGGQCIDFGENRPIPDWPERFAYHLTKNDTAGIDPLLVESGGDRIFWQRSTPGQGFRTCVGGVRGLTPETRHALLAGMLGVRDEIMAWPTQKIVNIAKVSEEQVQREIRAQILAGRAVLLESVQEFQAKGLISPEEAKTVLPKLFITIRSAPAKGAFSNSP